MSEGYTNSENYLYNLAKRSLLRFWSWPNLFRDQKAASGTGDGKEICDLLVIFGKHILIFSDKLCQFSGSENVQLDWSRWYKKAVLDSAKQAKGAMRWIMQHPDRVFTDRTCTHKLPFDLPSNPIFHLIIVAHGTAEHCHKHFGDSPSLMINSQISGKSHYDPVDNSLPFAIGRVLEEGPFIHVLCDFSVDVLLKYLTTATDFIDYLIAREHFLTHKFVVATGEEEILATYLHGHDGTKHFFNFPAEVDGVLIDSGQWKRFIESDSYKSKIIADKQSYLWDGIIDHLSNHIINQEAILSPGADPNNIEKCLRVMACENRISRRYLSSSVIAVINRARTQNRSVRLVGDRLSEVAYLILSLKHLPDYDEDEYRKLRIGILEHYCIVAKLKLPHVATVIGIATEDSSADHIRSEDLLYLDCTNWSSDQYEHAKAIQKKFNILNEAKKHSIADREFPVANTKRQLHKKRGASKCPCGSGKRYSKCCGKR